MNLSTNPPDIPDNWKGGVTETCRVLGGISPNTLRKYARLGRRRGGLECLINANNRMVFTGKEVKRFWRSM